MLQALREKTSGWIAAVILGLLCIPFAFFGMEQYLFQRNATFAAKLEAPPKWWPSAPAFWPVTMLWQREEIDADEFRTAFEQQRQQMRQAQGEQFDARAFENVESKRAVLEGMIDRRLMSMLAQRDGVVVGDAQVRDTIQAVEAFQVNGKFDPQSYQLALATQNQTPTQFQEVVRNDLQQTVVPRGIAESAFVTKSELERLLTLIGETRSVSIAMLPAPAADTAPVPAGDIQAWYQRHQSEFRSPETVTLEVLDIDASTLPAPEAPSESTLRERYEKEQAKFGSGEQRLVSHILVKDEKKAAQLAAQAKAAGADFAALAKANSEDTGSKGNGGDLGWLQQDGSMVKPFEDAVFAAQGGQIVGPVKSDFGFHVIQVREVKAGTQKSFEEVRDQLATEQAETDRERVFNDLLGSLVDEVYKNPTTLSGAASLGKLQVRTIGPVTRAPAPGADPIVSNPAVLRAAFADSAIQDGTVSDPIEIAPSHSVLLRVKAHTPERAQPLQQVRDRVVAAIRDERASKAASAQADAALKEIAGGKTLAALAEERGWTVTDMPDMARGMPVPDPAVNEAIFAVPAPAQGKVSTGKAEMPGGQYALFAVSKVTPGKPAEATTEQREQLRQQLAQIAGTEDAQALVREMRRKVKITVAEDRL